MSYTLQAQQIINNLTEKNTDLSFIAFIKDNIKQADTSVLASKLKYKDIELGANRINSIASLPLLGLDIKDGYFDGSYGVRSLINELLLEFKASDSICECANLAINEIMSLIEQDRLNQQYIHIFIETDFSDIM